MAKKHTLKHFFIPHEGNNYHPHILHTKRAIFYSSLFLSLKVLMVGFTVLLPATAFLTPDVVAEQGNKIIALVNNLRKDNGLLPLVGNAKLITSAVSRATDMNALGYFSHNGPEGHNLKYFLKQVGYNYSVAGENLAMGFSDAQDVVDAWVKSPTHYANIINKEYTQEGLGIVAGVFDNVPTVFVAQHFGVPTNVEAPLTVDEPVLPMSTTTSPALPIIEGQGAVSGVEVTKPSVPVIDSQKSSVSWKDENLKTKVVAKVTVSESVKNAVVEINGIEVPLAETTAGVLTGEATMPDKSKDVFKVVTQPSIKLTGASGVLVEDVLDWESPKVVSQSPIERYLQANSWLGTSLPIFMFLRVFYILALAFFVIALAVHIYVQEKQKHPRTKRILVQTVAMIGLLAVMIKY